MKKTLSVFFAVILIALTFTSCSSKPSAELSEANVTKTVDVAFEALKEFDAENLNKYVDSSTLDAILTFAKGHDQFTTLGKAIFENLSYEIKSIDLVNQTVTISVKNKDLKEVASIFATEIIESYSTKELIQNLTNDFWLNSMLDRLVESIDNANYDDNSYDITLNIEQKSDRLVLKFDENAEDRVSGGALSAITQLL